MDEADAFWTSHAGDQFPEVLNAEPRLHSETLLKRRSSLGVGGLRVIPQSESFSKFPFSPRVAYAMLPNLADSFEASILEPLARARQTG